MTTLVAADHAHMKTQETLRCKVTVVTAVNDSVRENLYFKF